MDSIELFSTHEFDSFWHFRGHDDLAGKLYLSPKGIKLVFSGPQEKMEPLYGYISGRDGPLTGYALNGSKLSLIDAFASGPSRYGSKPADFADVNVFANLCVVGRHLAKEDDPIPGELWLSFPFLTEWFGHDPYYPKSNGIEIRKAGTLLDAKLPDIGSRIRSFHLIRERLSYGCYSSDVQAFLYFEPDDCKTAQWAVQKAFSCTGLWTVLCGAHVAPSRIFFQDTDFNQTHIFVALGEFAYLDNLHVANLLLPFEIIKDRMEAVLNKWLGEQLPPYPVNLFLRAFLQRRQRRFGRETFQDLVTALEALADAECTGAPLMDKATAKELRKCLKDVINGFASERCVQEDAKKAILGRVDNINSGTLKQKLAGFRSKLPPDAQKRFVVLQEPLLSMVVETRHDYAHGRGCRDPSSVLHGVVAYPVVPGSSISSVCAVSKA